MDGVNDVLFEDALDDVGRDAVSYDLREVGLTESFAHLNQNARGRDPHPQTREGTHRRPHSFAFVRPRLLRYLLLPIPWRGLLLLAVSLTLLVR